MAISFFYKISNSELLLLFIAASIFLALIALIIFNLLVSADYLPSFENNGLSIFIGIISVAIGIIIAFIITNEWQSYNTAANNASQEANVIYILYLSLQSLQNTETQQTLLKQYLCNIINIEFPALQNNVPPGDNAQVEALFESINSYVPDPNISNQVTLYGITVDLLNDALFLRTQRFQSSTSGIPMELLWVIVLGFVIVIITTCLITGDPRSRAIMVIIVGIIYASLVFLVVALDYPFRGDFSLDASPFQFVANLIGVNCSST